MLLVGLQLVSAARQYIEVQLLDARSTPVGTIELKSGVLVGAQMGVLRGIDAARGLLQSPAHFRFVVSRRLQVPNAMTAIASLRELLVAQGEPPRGDDVALIHADSKRTAVEPVAVMHGSFLEFEFPSLLEVVGMSRQHTSVRIFDDQRQLAGDVQLKGGQVLTVDAHGSRGVAAVRRLLHSPRDFTFVVLRHPSSGDMLESIGTIGDVLGQAATPVTPAHVEARGTSAHLRLVDERRAASAASNPGPARSGSFVAWFAGALLGALFVLLGGAAATLFLRRFPDPDPDKDTPKIVEPITRQSSVAPEPSRPAPPTPVAPIAAGSGGAVFGPTDARAVALGRPAIASMQAALKQLGFHPGVIDGVMGPRTATAVREFQYAEQLAVDGMLSAPTRARLAVRVGGL